MPEYRVPGVFVEELSPLPPSVADVETALPAFIGYTEKASLSQPGDLHNVPRRIRSLVEFEACYGTAAPYAVSRVDIDPAGNFVAAQIDTRFYLVEALRLFYANGGGDCHVVSVGGFPPGGKAGIKALMNGLKALASVDGPDLLLFPDAVTLGDSHRGKLQQAALAQCAQRGDRFAVFDLARGDPLGGSFRGHVGVGNLKHGTAYTPWLLLHPARPVRYGQWCKRIFQAGRSIGLPALTSDPAVLALLARLDALCAESAPDEEIDQAERDLLAAFPLCRGVIEGLRMTTFPCPPSGAMAGIYVRTDRERGVWKAPANTVVNGIAGLAAEFSRAELEMLGSNAGMGQAINPIRLVPGKGWQVWGARTLLGNDNEWRYVPVRRFFIMVEASLKQAVAGFVFEPNDANTWTRVRLMIEDYLFIKWREGALVGARPEQAFFVGCGLGRTMTAQDVAEGRMVVEVGLAVLRPAEFIVFRLAQALAAD